MADAALPMAPRLLPRRLLPDGEGLILLAVVAYLALFTLWPLGRLLAEALAPNAEGELLGLLRDQWQSRSFTRALQNTLEASAFATVLSVALGTSMAFLLALTDVRAKTALTFVLLLPLLIPPQITALSWLELTGPSSPILNLLGLAAAPGTTNPLYSREGIVLVMGIEHATLVFLAVRAGLRHLPRDLVEAARLAGAKPLRATLSVIAPLAFPSILAGAALAFVSAIGNFGVPALLGIPGRYPMLTTLIYRRLNGFGPSILGEVAAIAVVLILLAVGGLALRALFSRWSRSAVERSSAPLQPFALGRARLPVEAGIWLVLAVIALLPLTALVASSLTPALGVPLNLHTATLDNYRFAIFSQAASHRAFMNSLMLAAATAVVSAAIAIPLAYLSILRRRPLARALDLVADTPYAIPGTVLAIGIILVYLPPLPGLGVSIYGTIWILLVAYLARFLTLALRPVTAGMETLEPALDEAARVAGAGPLRRIWSIVLPNVAPAAAAGGLLIFITALNELTVSALLWSSGKETIGVMIFALHYEGNSPAASALATATVAITLLIAFALGLLGRRLPDGAVPWRA
ncbi:ABC transporter permease [Lutibaculum baratangense]|uniref:Ferric iron ABC transporter, permease protein n=1 Tax=Lutibaculum baratangense AMV1 TaxID=631454 RepID=V4QUI8_9HYPH|nr:iron ABC transporter permease [Lutibaculum baratangense]ESR23392.1 Ferric iron ABC transporter, permease protein [Lutibaculum baratangense AMV1]